MGGTLPVLSRLVARDPTHLGRRVGLLYALNTFGAVVGSFCAGFLLLPALGFSRTNLLAASLNLAIAGVAWLWEYLAGGVPVAPSPRRSAAENPHQTGASLLLLACALAGFAALGYEVLWTRALILILGTTTYSFTTVLVTFLTGLALGSFLCSFLVDHCRDLRKLFAWIQVLIGGTVLLFTAVFGTFPFLFLKLYTIFGASAGQLTILKFLLAFLAMLLPTLFMGGVFPVISKLYTRDPRQVGHGIGMVYAANTVGAIFGAFTTGFVLLPWLGIKQSLFCLIYLNCGLALMIFVPPWPRHWRSLVGRLGPVLVIVVAVRLFLPSWNPALLDIGVYYGPEAYLEARLGVTLASRVHEQRLLHAREGLNATVAVFQDLEGERTLRINGKPVSSTIYDDMRLQRMIGHLPLLLHAHPQRVLVVGLGTGITLGAVARHAVEAIEVVEIEASVREAVSYFSRENHDVLAQPNVTLIIDDGRNYLEVTPQRYEVITSDPIHPWVAGAASLYTREYYQIAKRRLALGGLMAQWVPLYELSPDDYRMIVKTFAQVFPFVSLWFTGTDTLLIGSAQPWAIDVSRLREQLKIPAIREDLEGVHLHDPYILLSHFLFGETAIPSFVQGAQLNTDDHPRLEYTAPQSLYRPTMPENLMALLRYREPLLSRLRQIPPPEHSTIVTTLARYAEAKLQALWDQIYRWQGKDK
jgi:spermidine synthase